MMYLGDFAEDATLYFCFNTFNSAGASEDASANGDEVYVYKDDATGTEEQAGVTVLEAHDSLAGVHNVKIDLSSDAFYAAGADYHVILKGATIDGQTVNAVLACFSIENRFTEVDVVKWLGTAAGAVDTVGYPKVTIKDGTGTGELDTASGVVKSNAVQIDSTAQRATDLAEIAQYMIANSVTLTDVIADNSILAHLMAQSGDISDYSNASDSLEALAETIGNLTSSVGDGSISVDHDTGGSGNMTVKTSGGVGIDNVVVRGYLTSDYTAGNKGAAYVKGTTKTDVNGEWAEVLRLDAGAYTIEFSKQGEYETNTTTVTVS